MADDEYAPRAAADNPEWELEEMIRDIIGSNFRLI
jgi:hypothetical protein